MAVASQPEEYLDHVRRVSVEHVPTIDEEVEEYLMLREATGLCSGDEKMVQVSVRQRRQRGLMLSFIAMVFVALGNKVFQKLQTIPMYNYPNFLNLLTTFTYIPISFTYVMFMLRFGSAITPEQRKVPLQVFMVMGGLDGISGIMQTFAATYLNGSLLILLTQAAIPISMVVSKRLLKTQYLVTQYAGAVVVAAGIMVVLVPGMKDSAGGGGGTLGWACVMLLSCIPLTLSSVYKEIALGESELDPMYLNGWVSVFQFMVSIPLALPAALAGNPPVTPAHLPQNIWNGLKCFMGTDSVVGGLNPDHCWPGAPLYVTLYLIFNVAYNILIILILKYGSANLLFLAMTITVPLGNVAFALPFMPSHKDMRLTDVLGLVFIMGGLVVYRFGGNLCPGWAAAGGGGAVEDADEKERRQPLLSVDEDGSLLEGNLDPFNNVRRASKMGRLEEGTNLKRGDSKLNWQRTTQPARHNADLTEYEM